MNYLKGPSGRLQDTSAFPFRGRFGHLQVPSGRVLVYKLEHEMLTKCVDDRDTHIRVLRDHRW